MDQAALRQLMADVRDGITHPDDAVAALRHLPFADLGVARVDHHRHLRQGMGEAVYGPGKTAEQVTTIVGELVRAGGHAPILLTRASAAQLEAVRAADLAPPTVVGTTAVWRAAAPRPERVAVLTAGTADLPVADECAATLSAHGLVPDRLTDVGVAGIHRLLGHVDELIDADAVVVVAGMEGALASVVGGLTGAPVVAVPTSVGYGAGLDGVTALLSMLASCAAGVAVVGIDNGYGAACVVIRQLLTPERHTEGHDPRSRPVETDDARSGHAETQAAGGRAETPLDPTAEDATIATAPASEHP